MIEKPLTPKVSDIDVRIQDVNNYSLPPNWNNGLWIPGYELVSPAGVREAEWAIIPEKCFLRERYGLGLLEVIPNNAGMQLYEIQGEIEQRVFLSFLLLKEIGVMAFDKDLLDALDDKTKIMAYKPLSDKGQEVWDSL